MNVPFSVESRQKTRKILQPEEDRTINSKFIKEFLNYYEVIKDHKPRSHNKIPMVCKELFDDYTQPFFDRWKKYFSFLQYNKGYADLWYSFEMVLPRNIIIIPHKILVYETLCQTGVYSQFRLAENLDEFLYYFDLSFREINLKLSEKDIRILRGLTSTKFFSPPKRYPTLEQMAKICGCTRHTFSRRLNRLINSYVYFPKFMLDIAKLGYETFVSITSQKSIQKDPPGYNNYHLAHIPLDIPQFFIPNNERYHLLISQIPYQNGKIYSHIKENHKSLLFQPIKNAYIGWNLTSLTPDIKKRWRILPPILAAHDWSDEIISRNYGITYDLDPQTTHQTLSPIDIKILSWYVNKTTLQDTYLAKSLGVTPKYIRETMVRLLKQKLIHRFTIVSNIGLPLKPWISIIGSPDYDHGSQFIDNIVEHLKFFPFSRLFYDYGGNSDEARPLIVGRIFLPPTWMTMFLEKLSQLLKFGFDAHTSYAYDQIFKWNIDVAKTFHKS